MCVIRRWCELQRSGSPRSPRSPGSRVSLGRGPALRFDLCDDVVSERGAEQLLQDVLALRLLGREPAYGLVTQPRALTTREHARGPQDLLLEGLAGPLEIRVGFQRGGEEAISDGAHGACGTVARLQQAPDLVQPAHLEHLATPGTETFVQLLGGVLHADQMRRVAPGAETVARLEGAQLGARELEDLQRSAHAHEVVGM